MGSNNVNLPPGFRFYPTDEELVVHFLHRKAALLPFHPDVIPDLDLYPYDPWELDGKLDMLEFQYIVCISLYICIEFESSSISRTLKLYRVYISTHS